MRYEDQSQPTQPLGGAAPTPAEHYTRRMSDPPATPRPPRATPRDSTTWPSTTSIWQRWIGVTMLAGVLVAIFGGISVFAGQQIAPPLVSWTVAGTAAGLIVGLLQAVALSDYLPKRACILWIVLTALVGVSEGVFSGWTFTIQTLTIPFHTTEATGQMEGDSQDLTRLYFYRPASSFPASRPHTTLRFASSNDPAYLCARLRSSAGNSPMVRATGLPPTGLLVGDR